MPTWGGDLSGINFDEIYYYVRPTEKKGVIFCDTDTAVRE